MRVSKESLLRKGNESFALGALFSIVAVSCPCPACIGATAVCFLNSAREKFGISPAILERFSIR